MLLPMSEYSGIPDILYQWCSQGVLSNPDPSHFRSVGCIASPACGGKGLATLARFSRSLEEFAIGCEMSHNVLILSTTSAFKHAITRMCGDGSPCERSDFRDGVLFDPRQAERSYTGVPEWQRCILIAPYGKWEKFVLLHSACSLKCSIK